MERLRTENEKDGKAPGDYSYKSSTYKSKISSKSNAKVAEKVEAIRQEEENANKEEGKDDSRKDASRMSKLVEELIGTLQVCNSCSQALTEDERIINARFI
jgi:hypothetical protein